VAPPTVRVEQGPDSVASPQSERVPMVISDRELAVRVAGALAGPDSALAVPFIEAMGRAPQHEYDLVAERARWVIARVSGGKLVEPLLESLSDPDWRVKAYAAWALGTIQDSRAVPALVGLVRHPVWRLRAMAAYALAVSGDPRAAGVFREALNDPAWQVREQAVRYFAGIDSDDARELVLRARTDKHVAVRMAAER
jgi:HEAT repeat protein